MRFADFARRTPYVVRFIEFMPLDADRSWSADKVLPDEEIRRLINEVIRSRPSAANATAPRGAHASPTARARSASSPPSPVLLRRLRPHPPHRRGDAADLPVLAQRTDLRTPMREGRATRRSRRSCATPSGARNSSTTSATRASSSRALDVADRRVKNLPRPRRWSSRPRRRWRPSACRSARRPSRSPPRTAAARSTWRRSTARRWTATPCARPTRPRPAAAGRRGGRRRDGDGDARAGTAMGIDTGAAIRPARTPCSSPSWPRSRTAACARPRRSRPDSTSAYRGEDVHAGDLIAPPASR